MLSVFKLVSCQPDASRELALRSSKWSKLVSSYATGYVVRGTNLILLAIPNFEGQ